METAIRTELARLTRNAEHVRSNVATGIYDAEDAETAILSLALMGQRIYRCRKVLDNRYGDE